MPLGKRFAAAVRVRPSNFLCTTAVLVLACVLLFRPCNLAVDPTRWQVLSYAQQVCRCIAPVAAARIRSRGPTLHCELPTAGPRCRAARRDLLPASTHQLGARAR